MKQVELLPLPYDSQPQEKSLLKWVSAKMMFYAPTTIPTKILIELVSFKDDRLVPGAPVTTFGTAFWQHMTKKMVVSPLESGNTMYKKFYRVHKRIVWNWDPKETTDNSATRYKEVNMFLRLNRKCIYNWDQDDKMNMLTLNEGQVNLADNQTQCRPKYRMFIMIRGLATKTTNFDATKHPSFDIVLRTCHEQFSR